jgi:hypothetical protein
MPAAPHTTDLKSKMLRRGALVVLDVPPVAVGLQQVAEKSDHFRVVDVDGAQLVVMPAEGERTYRLMPGHVQPAH